MADLEQIIHAINKEQGYEALVFGRNFLPPTIPKISTGSLYLDWATNGGIPVGKITEIYGKESSGKSFIAAKIVSQAQKKGLNCVWIDAENSFDHEWMTAIGVDAEKLVLASSSEGEEVLDLMLKLVSMGGVKGEYKNQPIIDLIVCDSVAALAPMKVIEDDLEQAQMAIEARMMNRGVKRINARCKNTAVIFINQIRSGIGRMAADVTPGGRGLPFFASLRLDVRGGEWIKPNMIPKYMKLPPVKDKDTQVGHVINCRVNKSKVGRPKRVATIDFYYTGKIDQIKDIILAAKMTEVIEQAGAFYKYEGQSFRGAAEFGAFLRSDKEALKEIRRRVLESV